MVRSQHLKDTTTQHITTHINPYLHNTDADWSNLSVFLEDIVYPVKKNICLNPLTGKLINWKIMQIWQNKAHNDSEILLIDVTL